MTIEFQRVVPTFRIFSLEKAREFYSTFSASRSSGSTVSHPDAPVFMQVSRGGVAFHLSEHHGDGTPGSIAYVYTTGVRALHRELIEKKYRYNRPGLNEQEWGMTEVTVTDPFNNRITFGERTAAAGTNASAGNATAASPG